jgi:hypothetical protein
MRKGALRAGLTTGIAIACLATPAAATAAVTGTVTMYSSAGDYIGGGQQRVYDSGRGDVVSASGSAGSLDVSVSGGAYGDSYDFTFAAPDNQAFQPGAYTGAQRTSFRSAGRPGIDISGDGRGCNEDAGSFEVRDFALDASGAVQRAWIVYEQFCDGGPALFGEVRVGEPAGPTTPALARWPEGDVGAGGQAVPIVVNAPGATGATVTGDAASDFVIRENDCTAGAGGCQIWVRFVPTAPGVREAWLHVTDAAGTRADVPLQGYAYGGTTGLTMTSDPGDWVGGGQAYSYGPTSSIGVGGSRSHISASVTGANGDWWYLDFSPAAGDILAPGTYSGATRYPFNGSGPGLNVDGNGHGCNQLDGSFTVNELTFSGADIRTLSISFEQHCEHGAPALRGTLQLRAGDTAPPAPWMVSGTPPADPGPPPSGAPAPAASTTTAVAAPAVLTAVTPAASADPDARVRTVIAVEGARHVASAKAFTRAVASLRRTAAARSATSHLLAAEGSYRAALASAPARSAAVSAQRRALLAELARERASLLAFRTALRHEHGAALRRAREHALSAVADVT